MAELIHLDYISEAVSHVGQTRKWDALPVDSVWFAHDRTGVLSYSVVSRRKLLCGGILSHLTNKQEPRLCA